MNYFSVMCQKKLKNEGDDVGEGEEERSKKKGPSSKSKSLPIITLCPLSFLLDFLSYFLSPCKVTHI